MNLLRKLSWFFNLEKKRYLIGIGALILVSFLNLIPPRIMGLVIDLIDKRRLTLGQLVVDIALLVLAALAMYGLRFIWRRYIFGTANKLARILRYRLFKQFTLMSPSFYQRYRTGNLMAHATNDINAVTMFAGGGVMSAVDASVTALVTLVSMFFMIDWRLTLLAILPLPVMVVVTSAIGRKNHKAFKEAQEGFSELNNFVQESVSGVKVTKSFGFQADEIQAFEKTNQMVFSKNMTSAGYNALFDPTTLLFVGLSYVLTLYFGGLFVQEGSLTVGQIVTFITYLNMLVWPLQAMGFLFNISQRASVSYDRIETLLAETPDIQDPSQPVTVIQNGDLEYDIEEFAYEKEPVLEKVVFHLEKGQTLAIVGPTGIGKTSLSVWLAKQLNGEIISCDSMQVYKKMDVGTAKVTKEEMQDIHHELIDVQNYDEPYNVKVFQEKCRTAIEDVVKRGKFPILCGGTGLYLKAALYDYEFQEEEEDTAYTTYLNSKTNEELVAMLEEKDAKALEKIHPNNRKRMMYTF